MSAVPSYTEDGSIVDEPTLSAPASERIIFVDLDGTLISTDLFGECLVRACVRSPLNFGKLALHAARGRAALKRATANLVSPNVRSLPVRLPVLEFLSELRAEGWTIVLATATDRIWAEKVAEEYQIFDAVVASDGETNLKGSHKRDAIVQYCRRHGYEEFAYIGDSHADFPIWKDAARAFVVRSSTNVAEKLVSSHPCATAIGQPTSTFKAAVKTIRPQQWLKNALLFVPLLLAHQYTHLAALFNVIVAALSMSLCASAVYVMNDLLDMESDRKHPIKRYRPLAAGQIHLGTAGGLFACLLVSGFTIAACVLPPAFTFLLAVYVGTSSLYTIWLKKEAIADVMVLSGLYTLRVYAGGVAAGVAVSEWLLTLSIFLFTSLAFAKRHAELMRLQSEGRYRARGRGYVVSDLGLVRTLGAASGYLAVLVFALYTKAESTLTVYTNPAALWLICPLALFWVSRLWLLAVRGQLLEDPVVFALKDRVSLCTAAVVGLLLLTAVSPLV